VLIESHLFWWVDWAPYFIIESFKPSDDNFVHAGSLDIDIAVNPKKVSGIEYKSMFKLIEERGYTASLDKQGRVIPHAFEKNISIPGYKDKRPIEIDFMGPEYGGRESSNEERERIVTDSYMQINEFLSLLLQ